MFNQNTYKFSFDREKALEVLLYISSSIEDMYKTLKVVYFADKMHLSKYGRLINGNSYVAMKNGPVPSEAYDIIKAIKGDSVFIPLETEKSSLTINGNKITPLRKADLQKLSKSDIECLDESIKKYKPYSFNELHNESSDSAYHSTSQNDIMSLEAIICTLPNALEIKQYLAEIYDD